MSRTGPARYARLAAVTAAALAASPGLAQPQAQALGGGAVRFLASEEAAKTAPPSFVIEPGRRPVLPVPADFPFKPEFSSTGDSVHTVRVALPQGASLYGLGDSPGPFRRNGSTGGGDSVGSPWVLGVRPDGSGFGVLMDTTHACRADLTGDIVFSTDDPNPAVIVLDGRTPGEVLTALNELTGRMEMPTRWALGYHQTAAPGEEGVRASAKWLRDRGVPADALWLRPGPWGTFTWDAAAFPHPPELMSDLRTMGFHVVAWTPGLVPDRPGLPLYDDGTSGDHWIKSSDGSVWTTSIKSERFVVPDLTRAATRDWWQTAAAPQAGAGLAASPCPRLPRTASLRADTELGGPGTGDQYAAAMPTLLARTLAAASGGEKTDRRPFALVDAPAIGSQRYTGRLLSPDDGGWEGLRRMIPAALNVSLSGQPMVGAEIPNLGASDPLLARRWAALATTMPFVVGTFQTGDDQPQWTPEFRKTLTAALERRSRLIPYYYTLCFYAFFSCDQVLRPLFWTDPKDAALRDNDSGVARVLVHDACSDRLTAFEAGARIEIGALTASMKLGLAV